MARILLDIADETLRVTVKTFLERDAHTVVSRGPDAVITDSLERSVDHARHHITIVLVPYTHVRAAVEAMQQGVFGYALLPLVPGEIQAILHRALHSLHMEDNFHEKPLADSEMRTILSVLKKCNNNKTRAARILGIGRNTLWRKLKRHESNKKNFHAD